MSFLNAKIAPKHGIAGNAVFLEEIAEQFVEDGTAVVQFRTPRCAVAAHRDQETVGLPRSSYWWEPSCNEFVTSR